MRTDATIDRKQVISRNSSHIGYSKITARKGDIVIYNDDNDTSHVGRVIGRIVYAPALQGDTQPIRNYLLLAVLSQDQTFVMERWVNPEYVTQVFSVREETRKMLTFFFSKQFGQDSIDNMRRWAVSGFSTVSDWLAYEVTHEPTIA